ncbi:cobalamin biosynthesis protein CbiX [Agromyces protaetiae]|uniref:Cobalamin biosynthesis protein CbiX n=1 Tax=Agromyces protaetiae TaxID=2509455 RepID=A0A4P6FE88_9MICO|nr:CbiX/SirB N-terminal domain-containing protein [Agromyces protaetiae]QAY72719.1 cobalamin biosynthesis protein CbiX [Agromyces protaetiae]
MSAPVLLAVSHGTSSPDGQAAVQALVDAAAAALQGVVVQLGHVDVQEPDVAASLAALPHGSRVVVVPLLLSAGYHVHVDLRKATADHPEVHLAPALGPDARLARVLAGRLEDAGADDSPHGSDAIVLAVAGSSDDRANDDCRAQAKLLADELGVDVTIGFLAAAEPRLATAVAAARTGDGGATRVIVSSYLMAPGYFHDLVERAGADVVTRPLLDAQHGMAEAPAPELVDLVVQRYLDALDGPVSSSL